MKLKITDLMSLYEDEHCPLAPEGRIEARDGAEEEVIAVKERKHAFGWREGLSLAAALAIVVLGGFGVKKLLSRGPAARQGSPGAQSTTEAVHGPEEMLPLEGAEREEINRFLTAFAQQGVESLDTDLDEDAELIRFAFIYRRIHDPESIVYQLQDEQLTDTLSPEQVNETLTRLLGKTVTPDENANYDLLRSEPVGGHCSYHDGCFWQEPSGEDQLLRFALAERGSADGRVSFTVYGVNLYNWPGFELDPLPGLSREEAETLVREGKLTRCFYGDALLERSETGLRLLEYAKQDLAPEPVTDPEPETNPVPDGPEPSYDLDPVQLNALLTAFAEQGITDSDTELAGEYELAQFAHIWTKLHNYDAISWQTEDGESWETLTLEQVNEALTRLLGKTLSPAEGTDYTAQRGDNYAQHESYHDGCFWWPAADGDMHLDFAVYNDRDYYLAGKGSEELELSLLRIVPELWPEWEQTALTELNMASIQPLLEAGKLLLLGKGRAVIHWEGPEPVLDSYHLYLINDSAIQGDPLSPVDTEQATGVIPPDPSDSDPILPEEMTMEEIEAELGFGYQLPDVSEHNGKIQCAADHGTLALGYTSDEFVGRVVIWKSVKTDQDVYASWDQWPESGQETIKGVQVRFRGNSPDYKGIAFWTQDGYQYVMNCETAPGSDIMSILPLFIEDK